MIFLLYYSENRSATESLKSRSGAKSVRARIFEWRFAEKSLSRFPCNVMINIPVFPDADDAQKKAENFCRDDACPDSVKAEKRGKSNHTNHLEDKSSSEREKRGNLAVVQGGEKA